MRLNHLDILEQCFREKFRGYNKEEVDNFLHLVSDDFKEMAEELDRLKLELDDKDRTIQALKNSGGRAPIDTEILRQKAREVIDMAKKQADHQKKAAQIELDGLKQDIHRLTQEKARMIQDLKSTIRDHLKK